MFKKIRFILAAMLAMVVLNASPVLADAVIGKPAPDFTATDSNGKTVKLSDFKGRDVVLEWTNNECPFVRKHYDGGNMQSLQKKYTAQNVAWLQVISSAPEKQGHVDGKTANKLNADRNSAPTAVLLDPSGAIGKSYGAKTTPHMYIVDKTGALVYAGAIDSINSASPDDIAKAQNYIDLAFADMKAGKPVSVSSTKPYGCGVKYSGLF